VNLIVHLTVSFVPLLVSYMQKVSHRFGQNVISNNQCCSAIVACKVFLYVEESLFLACCAGNSS
jgi:hypothetical protein